MKDVLDEIVAHKRVEVEGFKQQLPPSRIYKMVEEVMDIAQPSMREALMNSSSGIIAEFKRKSPSKGWIKEDGKANEIPLSYQLNGASAISILTDEQYFGGNDRFIKEARESGVTIPILYKNFVIDEYQLFQARLCGASAVLLIAADLSLAECKSLMHIAHELGLEVLLEMPLSLTLHTCSGKREAKRKLFCTSVMNVPKLRLLIPYMSGSNSA